MTRRPGKSRPSFFRWLSGGGKSSRQKGEHEAQGKAEKMPLCLEPNVDKADRAESPARTWRFCLNGGTGEEPWINAAAGIGGIQQAFSGRLFSSATFRLIPFTAVDPPFEFPGFVLFYLISYQNVVAQTSLGCSNAAAGTLPRQARSI